MMKRRQLLLLFIAVGLPPLVGLWIYWVMTPRPGLTFDHFGRCYRGMTVDEVESVLGPGEKRYRAEGLSGEVWHVEVGDLRIGFENGRAVNGDWRVGDFYYHLSTSCPG